MGFKSYFLSMLFLFARTVNRSDMAFYFSFGIFERAASSATKVTSLCI